MSQKRCALVGLSLSLGLIMTAFATGAAAQTPAEAAWRSVKALLEAGPMLVNNTRPISVRLTGEPCNSRLVPVDSDGPMNSGVLVRWRELGRASSQAVDGGHVVRFATSVWFGFPPFEAGQTQEKAAAFDQLVQLCEQQPMPEGEPQNDRYVELEATFQRLKTELDGVVSADLRSEPFAYRVDRSASDSACHFKVAKSDPGVNGTFHYNKWVEIHSATEYNLMEIAPHSFVTISNGRRREHLQMDSPARAQAVLGLLNQMNPLCAEFQSS